jgi:predicted acylesterase/phospholipase RssA/CRP-like cAMP-binding protein
MTRTDLVRTLGAVPLLHELPASTLAALAAGGRAIEVPARTVLFEIDAPADGMYVVLSGRLTVSDADGTALRVVGPGAAIGELALLTGRPRSARVTTSRDSLLHFVPRDLFLSVLSEHAPAAVALATALASELSSPPAPRRALRSVGLLGVVSWDPAGDLAGEQLTAALPHATTVRETADPGDWAELVDRAEAACGDVLLMSPQAASSAWAEFCRRTADEALSVGATAPPYDIDESSVLAAVTEPATPWPEWAASARQARRARLISGTDAVGELARRLAGCAPGIVLSGGGARGLAHVGVLQALEERGRRPLRWAGCSMGAFVAALGASGLTATEIEQVCRAELVERRPFRDLALRPRHGLIRAERGREMLTRTFGSLRIEDLPQPFLCVSADLATGELVVHREGSVAVAVGASMSIPGIAPPVRHGDRWLVDGGVLDNLPVDVLQAGGEGPVLAVDVMRTGEALAGAVMPSLRETLGQALTIAGRRRVVDNRAAADFVLTPRLTGVRMFDFARMDEAVRAGREAVEDKGDGGEAVWGRAVGAGQSSS